MTKEKNIIVDASVIVSGHLSGNIHKTGLYRVTYEIITRLCDSRFNNILLYDVFQRERILKKIIRQEFPQARSIKGYSWWYRLLIFPIGDAADRLRLVQLQPGQNKLISRAARLFKNLFLVVERSARKIDRFLFIKSNLNRILKRIDLFYSTYYPIPEQIKNDRSIRKVYTIHDLIPMIYPEYFESPYNQKLVKEVVDNIENQDYVVCVSESTKSDLLKYRPDLSPEHVFANPLAASEEIILVSDPVMLKETKTKYQIPEESEYLLSVCTLEPRKNLKTLIGAYRNILEKGKAENLDLVLTGASGWKSESLIEEIASMNDLYQNRIHLTGFVPDKELAALYSSAFAFVYPSYYEGFGLPPLEAMQCGVPVISSGTSSLPEVIGKAGIYIEPDSETELVNAILKLRNNRVLRDSLSKKSVARAKEFNWNKTVDRLNKIFHIALNSTP